MILALVDPLSHVPLGAGRGSERDAALVAASRSDTPRSGTRRRPPGFIISLGASPDNYPA